MKYGKILIQSFAVAMTGFGRVMRPYFNNLTNRAIKTPKIYFFDTGLVSFLCGWTSVQTLERGSISGNIFENYCISEIMKSYLHNGKNPAFYYYRDKDNREIDLLYRRKRCFVSS